MDKNETSTETKSFHVVDLGDARVVTGKQPRGHKSDGGAAGGDYKDASESPKE